MLPQALKLKVIQQAETGKLQKDIAHDLGISTGSVSMILKASKAKHPDSILGEQASVVAKDQIISQSPSPYKKEPWEQQQPPPASFLPSAVQATFVTFRRDGGPLSHFFSGKDEDTMMTVPDSISSADGLPAPLNADVINSSEEPNPPSIPSDSTYSPGWDPDDEQTMRTRFLKVIIAEREKRHQEFLLINKEKELIAQERRNLALEKKQLDYERHNLEARHAEVEKYRDILPSAKQLREMGVDLVGVSIWIEVINDKAATEGITPKEAVALIVQELKLYNQFNSLEKAIHKRQQDLEALNIVIEEHKGAISTLVDLKSKGISDTDLIKIHNTNSEQRKSGEENSSFSQFG